MDSREEMRFLKKVEISNNGCWEWIAYRDTGGYGVFCIASTKKLKKAHRIAFEHWIGVIPNGLEIDHLCRNRRCVNPTHLEPVTHLENIRRGINKCPVAEAFRARTACEHGHPFDQSNTYWVSKNGIKTSRKCRTCAKLYQRKKRIKRGFTKKHHTLYHAGQVLTMAEWSRKTGLSQSLISRRITFLGWDTDRALTERPHARRSTAISAE